MVAAGARRIVVVRAIRDAADPEAAARELRAALEARHPSSLRLDGRAASESAPSGASARSAATERSAELAAKREAMAARTEAKNEAAREELEPLRRGRAPDSSSRSAPWSRR